jgi:hypothetical protein
MVSAGQLAGICWLLVLFATNSRHGLCKAYMQSPNNQRTCDVLEDRLSFNNECLHRASGLLNEFGRWSPNVVDDLAPHFHLLLGFRQGTPFKAKSHLSNLYERKLYK